MWPYTHSSVFRLSRRAKHWPSSYCFTPNEHQVERIFLVLIRPIRRALSKWAFRRWFCLHPAADVPFLFAKTSEVLKMAERNPHDIDRKSTQIAVIDKCIICSVDVPLRSLGARTRRNLQSTVPSATALRENYLFLPSRRRKCHSILGAGKAAFVCGICTCRLNRFDTIRRKYEAVKEDLEAQKRVILALQWQSHPQAQAPAQPQPRPQSVMW